MTTEIALAEKRGAENMLRSIVSQVIGMLFLHEGGTFQTLDGAEPAPIKETPLMSQFRGIVEKTASEFGLVETEREG